MSLGKLILSIKCSKMLTGVYITCCRYNYFFLHSSEKSLVVLDDLHRLVEYVQVGEHMSVSHSLLHVLSTLLTSSTSSGITFHIVLHKSLL